MLQLTSSREVSSARCECSAGITRSCKNISAVVFAVNEEDSTTKTSLPCEWNKPSSSKVVQMKYGKCKRFAEMFPFPKNHTRKNIQEYSKRDLLYNVSNIPCMLKTMLLS